MNKFILTICAFVLSINAYALNLADIKVPQDKIDAAVQTVTAKHEDERLNSLYTKAAGAGIAAEEAYKKADFKEAAQKADESLKAGEEYTNLLHKVYPEHKPGLVYGIVSNPDYQYPFQHIYDLYLFASLMNGDLKINKDNIEALAKPDNFRYSYIIKDRILAPQPSSLNIRLMSVEEGFMDWAGCKNFLESLGELNKINPAGYCR